MPQNHQITKQRIVISSGGKSTGQISDEIQKAKEQTSSRIENIFDQYIPDDRLIEMDSVNLNLGLLPSSNFMAEYQRRLTLLLENELRKLSGSSAFQKYVQAAPVLLSDRYEQTVRYFLQGYEPDLQSEPGFEITTVVKQLLEQDSQRLATALEKVWLSKMATLRAQKQLAPAIYRKIESLRFADSLAREKMAEKPSGTEISEALERYFTKGTFPGWFNPASLLGVEQYHAKVKGPALKELAAKMQRMLTEREVRKRLAQTLSIGSLKSIFSALPELKKPIEELDILEAALRKEAIHPGFLDTLEFKQGWLRYLAASGESEKQKVFILLEVIQQSGSYEELSKGFLKGKNFRNSTFKRTLPELKEPEVIQLRENAPAVSTGYMGILLDYLENGMLPTGPDFNSLLSRMLVSHSVLLKKTLLNHWHLYPLRYRLAYQADEKHLIELIQLLFSDTDCFQSFEALFDTATHEKASFPSSSRRHLYFVFFNLMAHSTIEGFTKKSFSEHFVLELSALFPGLKMDMAELPHLVNGRPVELGRYLLEAVAKNTVAQKEAKSVKETLEELVLEGSGSEAYQRLVGKKRLHSFFDQVISGRKLRASMLLEAPVHGTFWSEVMAALNGSQLTQLTAQLALVQQATLNGIRGELTMIEAELGRKPRSLHPLKKKDVLLILQLLVEENFALSEKQFAELYFQKAWGQLKNKPPSPVPQNLLNRLWIKSAHPEFQFRFPLISNWLRGKEPLVEAGKSRLQELKRGVAESYRDKYTSIDLVKFYLQKSTLPAWSSLKNQKELSAILEQLLEDQRPEFAQMAVAIQNENVQMKLINMMKPQSFYRLLNYMGPDDHAAFLLVVADLKSTVPKLLKVSTVAVDSFLKLRLLQLLSRPRNREDWQAVQDLLQTLSREHSLAYAKFMIGLHKGLKSFKSKILKKVVQREYTALQQPDTLAWRRSVLIDRAPAGRTAAEVLKHYLLKGTIPKWSTAKGKEGFAKLLRQGLKSNPAEVMEVLHSLKKKKLALSRFMELLRLTDFELVFGLLANRREYNFLTTVNDLLQFQKLNLGFYGNTSDFKHALYSALLKSFMKGLAVFDQDKNRVALLIKTIAEKYEVNELSLIHQLQLHYSHFQSPALKGYLRDFTADPASGKDSAKWALEGILDRYKAEYSTTHLILYYLKTLRFPVWGKVKNKATLAALFKKGIDTAPIEIIEILSGLKEDSAAMLSLVKLVKGKTLTNALRLIDAHHLKRYKPITDDFLNSKSIAQFSQLKAGELKEFVHFLLLSAMVDGQPVQSSAEFATYLLDELSRKFSFDKNEWFETVGKEPGIFKNKVLQKVSADYWLSVPTVAEGKAGTSPHTEEIDTFLYLIAYQKLPWWRMAGNEKLTVSTERKRLYKLIFTAHLPQLMKSIAESGREDFYLKKVFTGISSTEFHRVVSAVAPDVAGFVRMYTRVLEELSKTRYSSLSFKGHPELYLKIYRNVMPRTAHFSAVDFARNMAVFLSRHLEVGYQTFVSGLIEESEKLFKKGELQFKTLTQILGGLQYSNDSKTVPLSEPVMKEILHEKLEADFTETLAHYLSHGSLPAGIEISSYQDLATKFKAYALSEPLELRLALGSSLGKPIAVQRIQRHGDSFLIQLAAFSLNTTVAKIERWLKGMADFLAFTNRRVSKATFHSVIWEVLLNHMSHRGGRFEPDTLIQWVFKRIVETPLIPHFQQNLDKYFLAYQAGPGISSEFKGALQKAVAATSERVGTGTRKITDERHQPLEGQLEIQNAGMVILANYLPRYFEMLKMTENRAFKDEETAARAVHLLQYLVSGQNETPEYELVLNKIFCGLELAYPVELSISLSDKERDISESLLKGILQNWGRMKSNSIESLREGFLMRNGHLREAPHEWELEVEQSGKDILLDYLPWSFNMIKLPWMTKGMNVKWRNKKPNP